MIDLHCHSTASDGVRSPTDVVVAASEVGLRAIALTDHDSTDGITEARAAGNTRGVEVVGGCEFSVAAPWGEMHLLGYFIEPGDPTIEAFLADERMMRRNRADEMVDRLHEVGVLLDRSEIAEEAGTGAVGRPHVARALHRLGHVPTIQSAFDRYIGRGRPAFVEKVLPALRKVADLVHARNGIVSAAHLKSHGTLSALTELKNEGLDAVEVRHPSHDGDRVAILTEAVLSLGLGRSGGSDWHGDSTTVGTHGTLGSQKVPYAWLEELRNRRGTTASV